ncbi:MAG: Sec-independent protein translocase protein TatB [Bradyrhizobium sp.]
MFDISWSEFAIIAVVALIAIGPKELPGVLRMVGQWIGKARKMAAEFQGQFQEAMREAEMADLKKSFDEVKEAATGFTSGNVMTSLQKDVSEALKIDDVDRPAASVDVPTTSNLDALAATYPEASTDTQAMTSEPLALTPESQPQPAIQHTAPAAAEVELARDAKAS